MAKAVIRNVADHGFDALAHEMEAMAFRTVATEPLPNSRSIHISLEVCMASYVTVGRVGGVVLAVVLASCDQDRPTAPEFNGRSAAQRSLRSATTVPNVVVFLLDDATYAMVDRQTMPRLFSWVADSGVVYEHAYANAPLCCPSRATLISGLYQHNHGVLDNGGNNGGALRFRDGATIATALKTAGYVTALHGKYLNNDGLLAPKFHYIPPGWDDWQVMTLVVNTKYRMNYFNWYERRRLYPSTGAAVEEFHGTAIADYQPYVVTSRLAPFVRSLPTGQPFFALVAPLGPHLPAQSDPQDHGSCDSRPTYRPPQHQGEPVCLIA